MGRGTTGIAAWQLITVTQCSFFYICLQCTLFLFFLLGPPLFNVTSVTPPETPGKSNIFNLFLQYIFINLNRVAYG